MPTRLAQDKKDWEVAFIRKSLSRAKRTFSAQRQREKKNETYLVSERAKLLKTRKRRDRKGTPAV